MKHHMHHPHMHHHHRPHGWHRPHHFHPYMFGWHRPRTHFPMMGLGWIIFPLVLILGFTFFIKTWWLWLLLAIPFMMGGWGFANRMKHETHNWGNWSECGDWGDGEKAKNDEKPKRDFADYPRGRYEIIDEDDDNIYRV